MEGLAADSRPASGPENASTPIPSQPIDPPPPPPSIITTNTTATTTLEPIDHIGSPPRKKQCRGIDDARRQALCRYQEEHLGASQRELRYWFADKFHYTISQSICSKSFSRKFLYLNIVTDGTTRHMPDHVPGATPLDSPGFTGP
jgi:hypothetical protein